MILGDLEGLKLPDICLTGEKNSEKTSPRKLVPTEDRTWARCMTGAHATACSAADGLIWTIQNFKMLSSIFFFFLVVALLFSV